MGEYMRHWVTTSDSNIRRAPPSPLGADTTEMCLLATLVSEPEATAWSILAGTSMKREAKTLVRELRKQIKRPAARKQRVERSGSCT
jgi:hypothetical protein